MCRFSKEIEACTSQEEGFDLGRRSLDQLWRSEDSQQVEQSVSSPTRTPATEATKNGSNMLSLSDEIDNLIKWNREKSRHRLLDHALKQKSSDSTDQLDSSIVVPMIESFPSKKLSCQDGGSKFGLINKNTINHGAFVHKERYNGMNGHEGASPTLNDIMDKVEQTMCSQQYLLKTFLNHNQHLTAQIDCLKKQVSSLTQLLEQKPATVTPTTEKVLATDKLETLNKFTFLSYLSSKSNFSYALEHVGQMEEVFVKERNFKMQFKIINKGTGDQISEDLTGLFLELKLYSSENPPKQIEVNTSGNSILKGNTVREFKNGICTFDRLQIKEVSSHYRNGWLFIVVQPKSLTDNSRLAELIQPFVVDNVVVKAKLNAFGSKKREDDDADN